MVANELSVFKPLKFFCIYPIQSTLNISVEVHLKLLISLMVPENLLSDTSSLGYPELKYKEKCGMCLNYIL